NHTQPHLHFFIVYCVTIIIVHGQVSGDLISGQFREVSGRGGQFREGDARGSVFREGEAKGTFSIRRVEPKPSIFKAEEVTFRNADVTLSGTLLLPLTKGRHPAVAFLHGSGAEGREASRFVAEY